MHSATVGLLDAINDLAARFSVPGIGCVLVDANMPADLCVQIQRSALAETYGVVDILFGLGEQGHEVRGILDQMRTQDFAILVPASALPAVATPEGSAPTAVFGLPIYHVRSRLSREAWRVFAAGSKEAACTP